MTKRPQAEVKATSNDEERELSQRELRDHDQQPSALSEGFRLEMGPALSTPTLIEVTSSSDSSIELLQAPLTPKAHRRVPDSLPSQCQSHEKKTRTLAFGALDIVRKTAERAENVNRLDMMEVFNLHDKCIRELRTYCPRKWDQRDIYQRFQPCKNLLEYNVCGFKKCRLAHDFVGYLFWISVAILKFPGRARGGQERLEKDGSSMPVVYEGYKLCTHWSLRGFLFEKVAPPCPGTRLCIDNPQLRPFTSNGASKLRNYRIHSMHLLEHGILRMFHRLTKEQQLKHIKNMMTLGFTATELQTSD